MLGPNPHTRNSQNLRRISFFWAQNTRKNTRKFDIDYDITTMENHIWHWNWLLLYFFIFFTVTKKKVNKKICIRTRPMTCDDFWNVADWRFVLLSISDLVFSKTLERLVACDQKNIFYYPKRIHLLALIRAALKL